VWESPGAIGSTTANTGTFTTVTAGTATGYRLQGDPVFLISNTVIRTQGWLDVTTPNSSTTGGVRIRGNQSTNFAYLQITNSIGDSEWSNFRFNSAGRALYTGSLEVQQDIIFNGSGLHGSGSSFPNTEIGYKTIPQIITNTSTTIDVEGSSGAHHYKTTSSAISITIPNDTASPIGTAITIINDAATGNITLTQGAGVTLQLGGTLTTGNRTIGPGGFVTVLKVNTNKWIVSGIGVT
jgi:hypothetical protein